jgi:predicted Fe-Mo cluster-binding NifX family protein
MKTIAISAATKSLDATVEQLFGRSRFFILADPDTMEWEALDNMPSLSAQEMIGPATARNLMRQRVDTVITGKCGPKAFEELTSAGVKVILDTKGTVREALERLKRGDFKPAVGPNVGVSQ